MISFIPLQTLEHVARQSEMIARSDPYGWKISIVSLIVVLISLCILYLCYLIIGKIVGKIESRSSQPTVHRATDTRTDNQLHDRESYRLTFSHRPKATISSNYEKISRVTLSDSQRTDGQQEEQNKAANISGSILSPLPGILTSINVKAGDKVSAGQTVAKLEAMKMENSIEAEIDGTVTEVYVSKGDSVLEGTALMKIQ